MTGMVFSGLLVAILVAAPVLAAESPLPVSTTVSAVSSTPAEVPAATPSALVTVDISDGWRFRTDPRRTGTGGRWDAPTANDSRWTVADASGPWERYAPGYVGVAWYRRWVDCPPVAERAFLIVEGLAARADLFVDGWPMGKEVRGPRSVRELTSRVRGKARFLLALKVTGPARGGIAGLTGSVKLATGGVSRPLFPDLPSWIRFLAGEFPGMPWPGWARELSPEASPMGDPALAGNGWLGRHGEFSPADGRFAVSCWLYDRPGKRLYAPEFTAGPLALMDKVMPVPIARAGAGRFALQASYWAEPVPGRPGVAMAFGQATVQNNSDRYREAELVIAVHPFSPRCGGVCAVKSVAWDKTTQCILVNGIPAVVLAGSPDGVGAAVFAEEDTIARFVARGELPSADRAEDPEGLASAAAVYRLNIQPFGARTQTFRVLLDAVPGPLDPAVSQSMRDLGLKSSLKDTRDRWSRLLYGRERPRLRIREQQAQNCWYASVGAILASLGREMHPTDRAMTVAALLRAGLPDEAGVALKRLEKEAFSPSGSPTARIAWVWAASSMVRFSRVEVPFGAEWPAVSRACRDAAGMASSPSASADDLAWSARALAEGAWAARLLGKGEDASWMRTSGETAVQALTQRLTADPRSWLGLPWPGASLVTGAFASSTAVLDEWSPPVRPRRPGAPAPAPSDTRFRPPAVLAYAHSAVLALRSDLAGRALLASVSRYSVPGAYAWADESGGGLPPAGENPSIRAAAEYACLIRDAIVREEGDSLLLATGIPEQFTTPGFMLDIRYVPTTFGVFAGYSLTISPLSMELRIFKANEPARRGRSIQVREGDEADPPGGLKWHVPGTRRIRRLVVDGRLAHEVPSDRWINIDRDTRRVSVIW